MKNDLTNNDAYSGSQLIGLVILRILIGWHFLYEGISKLVNPYWSSAAYLLDSVNMWGLTIVGLSLLLGFMSRYGAIVGLVFVLLYYFFAPPFIGLEYSKPGEGSYIIVNKNLIEAGALYVLYLFPTSQLIGLDRLILSIQSK